jgi:hypothetical protein
MTPTEFTPLVQRQHRRHQRQAFRIEAEHHQPAHTERAQRRGCLATYLVGVPAPNLHLAQQFRGGTFKVAGGAPSGRVSWHLTGLLKGKSVASKLAREKVDSTKAEKFKKEMISLGKLVQETKRQIKRR